MKLKLNMVLLAAAVATTGCASVAVSDEAIEENTAMGLGLKKGTFTISDRVNRGIKTTYAVTTAGGKKYSCYVTGGMSMVGAQVSDAVCTEMGKASGKASAAPAAATPATCNALLKAAGKC